MHRKLPLILWTLVVVAGLAVLAIRLTGRRPATPDSLSPEVATAPQTIRVPWKHLPHISRFRLTDQTGREFDSADYAGRPMVVSFFFTSCPTICRDLNKTIAGLRDQFKNEDLLFVSFTVDPENDTPEVLARYAADFDADPRQWVFLTGQPYQVRQIGEHEFRVVVDKDTHTDNILLVDRWGRYRDRFTWDDPAELKRFAAVAKDVLAEQEPPLELTIETRNLMAGVDSPDWKTVPWIRDFQATDSQERPFYSRDLTGQVWIGSLFFTSCPSICVHQNEYLAGLQSRLKNHPAMIISLTTDPQNDTPAVLREYAHRMGANPDVWKFITAGDPLLTRRIAAEFFGASAGPEHHSSMLFVVDRWGNVRGQFDWQQPHHEIEMLDLIDRLNAETRPPARFEKVVGSESADESDPADESTSADEESDDAQERP